jgi:hypothetical protein
VDKVGIYQLEPGRYTIRFECIGASPLARTRGVANTRGGERYLEETPAGQPGYHMGLDGISLRKLPWEDMWSWMQDYLKREKKLFAEWIEEAGSTVTALEEAIERFRADKGSYPLTLDELSPSLGPIPLDTWGQRYRYKQPGKFNPDRFDVWSVHGNERDPTTWIGNWDETDSKSRP